MGVGICQRCFKNSPRELEGSYCIECEPLVIAEMQRQASGVSILTTAPMTDDTNAEGKRWVVIEASPMSAMRWFVHDRRAHKINALGGCFDTQAKAQVHADYLNALEAEAAKWRELAESAEVLVRHLPDTTWLWEQKGSWLAAYEQARREEQ